MLAKTAKILVVDDSASTRKVAKKFFVELGYSNIEEAADGKQAFEKVTETTPRFDLVFSDWHMPNVSGFELLQGIRASDDASIKKIPVILGTAERKAEEVKRAILAGVTGYVVKPYSADSIKKSLENIKEN